MQYQIIAKTNTRELAAAVSEQLAQGWKLHGSPVISLRGSYTLYAQALIKE